jgi:hypothetical protein
MGDDIHVPTATAVLDLDEANLYIITFYAEQSLCQIIGPNFGVDSVLACRDQMYGILTHLLLERCCHHNITPSNFLVHGENLLLNDFTMAFPTLHNEPVQDNRVFGGLSWMMPRHYHGMDYFPLLYDHWAMVVILYSVATGKNYLYTQPTNSCFLFEYHISAGALSRNRGNTDNAQSVVNRLTTECEIARKSWAYAHRHWSRNRDIGDTELLHHMENVVLLCATRFNSCDQKRR